MVNGVSLQWVERHQNEWWMAKDRTRRDRFDEGKIASIIKQLEAGRRISELSREWGVSRATLYVWKAKYQSGHSDESLRVRVLEEENWRLKQLVGELYLERERLSKKSEKKRFARS